MSVLSFTSAGDFRVWLGANHDRSTGVWLRIYKKGSGVATVTYAEALDQALCFGWIDGQKKPCDSRSWLQRFTPRRLNSGWSKINTQHAQRLIQSRKMAAPGLEAIRAAKNNGRWAAAYDSPSHSDVPRDFVTALNANRTAKTFFETLNRANVYAITYRIQTAKTVETRQKWITRIIRMLEAQKRFHKQTSPRAGRPARSPAANDDPSGGR